MKLIASLCTIPPRVQNGDLKKSVDSLLSQTYPVNHVFVTIPRNFRRFGRLEDIDLPQWLDEEPYFSRVTIIRKGEDEGPILKYTGSSELLLSTNQSFYTSQELEDLVMFVGDDDQEYHPQLIERMMNAYPRDRRTIVQNRYRRIEQDTSGGIIHGFVGVLVPLETLRGLSSFAKPPEGFFVDDQLMSIYFDKNRCQVVPSGVEDYRDIYSVLMNGHEKAAMTPESLSGLNNRAQSVRKVCEFYKCSFNNSIRITYHE